MSGTQKLGWAALTLSVIASVFTGLSWWKQRQMERHLRGLDVAMAEIGYRYGELHFACRNRTMPVSSVTGPKMCSISETRWNGSGENEISALVAFLESLNGEPPKISKPVLP